MIFPDFYGVANVVIKFYFTNHNSLIFNRLTTEKNLYETSYICVTLLKSNKIEKAHSAISTSDDHFVRLGTTTLP